MALRDPRHQRYLEWLMTPRHERVPPTLRALARELGVDDRTVRGWRDTRAFREEWDRLVDEVTKGPERIQNIFDQLYQDAIDPNNRNRVASQKLFLEAVGAIKSNQDVKVSVSRSLSEVSDEELDALLAEHVSIEKARRALGERAEALAGELGEDAEG